MVSSFVLGEPKLQKCGPILVLNPMLNSGYRTLDKVTPTDIPLPLFTHHDIWLLNLKYYPSPAVRH